MLALATVVTYDHLHQTLAMLRSLRQAWSGAPRLYVALVDQAERPRPGFAGLDVAFVPIEQLQIPNLPWVAAKLAPLELCGAVKPFLLLHLLRLGWSELLYLDSDLFFFDSPEAFGADSPEAELVMSPHILSPPPPHQAFLLPTLGVLADAGTMNTGLFLVRDRGAAARFLEQWADLVVGPGAFLRDTGSQREQNAFNWAPSFMDRVAVCRDPRHNVAYWNLFERPLRWAALDGGPRDRWLLGGQPIVSFHFSGFTGTQLSCYSQQHRREHNPNLDALASCYEEALAAAEQAHYTAANCTWAAIGGRRLGAALRDELKRVEAAAHPRWPSWPQDMAPLLAALVQHRGTRSVLPAYLERIRSARPDLEQLDPDGALYPRHFLAWCRHYLPEEYPHLRELEDREWMLIERGALGRLALDLAPYLPGPAATNEQWLVERRHEVLARVRESGAPPELWGRVAAGDYFVFALCPIVTLRMLYDQRPDVQRHLPAPLDTDLAGFKVWLAASGRTEYAMPEAVHAAAAALDPQASLARVLAGARQRPPVLERLRQTGLTRAWLAALTSESGPDYAFDHRDLALVDWWLSFDHVPDRDVAMQELVALALPEAAAPSGSADALPAARGVNLFGYFKSPIGLGSVSTGLESALARAGFETHRVLLTNASMSHDFALADLRPAFRAACRHNLVVSYPHIEHRVDQVFPPAWFAGRETLGYLAWEQRDFPARWTAGLAVYDRLFALSQFAAAAIAAATGRRCEALPCVVDGAALTAAAAPFSRRSLGLPESAFLVGIVADAASALERKNPGAAVAALARAFSGRRDVVVVLKVGNGQRPQFVPAIEEWVRLLDAAGLPCQAITRPLPAAEVAGLMAQLDLYVSLHRSEGFGLTIGEAMALGVPVVATGYSGNMDFMTPDNSGVVGFRESVVRVAEGPFQLGTVWAEPDVAHAAELCDWVYRQPSAARARARRAQADIAALASPEAVGSRLAALLG